MKRALWIAGAVVMAAARPSHALFGRDAVSSLWPAKPIVVDGRATEWSEMPVLEEAGISVRAMNDTSSLYLLIRGTTSDGRVLLSGKYRQDVMLWFLKADHKSRAWGINLDFSKAQLPALDTTTASDVPGIAPEMILPQGLEVSTTTFPEGFEFQADLSSQRGRQPIYEIRIPLSMVERSGKSIYLDIASSEVSPDVKAGLQADRTAQHSGEESHTSGGQSPASGGSGGRHHRGMGGSGGGSAASSVEIPKPMSLHLTIKLAKEPH